MSFHVGQKVVCVLSSSWGEHDDDSDPEGRAPQYGDVCTIAVIVIEDCRTYLGLEEYRPDDWFFNACSFRPITERKTDISIFKKLLEPSTRKVKERA